MRFHVVGARPRQTWFGKRSGISSQLALYALAAGAVSVVSALWFARPLFSGADASQMALAQQVTRGRFEHDIVERGELESSNNTLVRCEVRSHGHSNGVKILEIVPEGTLVKKGDFLVRFDDAALQTERTTQLINVGSAEAAAAQSQNDLEAAVISRKEYEFGEFESEREKVNGEILVASQAVDHAAESVHHSRKMLRRGYVPRLAVRSDEFRLAKAESDLKAAKVRLNALVEYTRPKKISELDSKVKTCQSKLKSDEAKLALERQKLKELDDQIARCVVTAPVDGQVVYDHERDEWDSEHQIKQGAVIYEQRIVIRLPDPSQMQVVAKVAEARIDRIKVGMPAKIEVEGLPDVVLQGKVTRVNEYPASENWFNANVKEYATTVEVSSPPTGLRAGMTARVAIRVETIGDALQVPIQSVVEHSGSYYCLRRHAGELEPRRVKIGSTNEKFIVVSDGLADGEWVLLNPRAHLAEFQLGDARLLARGTDAKAKAQDNDKDGDEEAAPAPAAVGGARL